MPGCQEKQEKKTVSKNKNLKNPAETVVRACALMFYWADLYFRATWQDSRQGQGFCCLHLRRSPRKMKTKSDVDMKIYGRFFCACIGFSVFFSLVEFVLEFSTKAQGTSL